LSGARRACVVEERTDLATADWTASILGGSRKKKAQPTNSVATLKIC
jgi:hypothetical protein